MLTCWSFWKGSIAFSETASCVSEWNRELPGGLGGTSTAEWRSKDLEWDWTCWSMSQQTVGTDLHKSLDASRIKGGVSSTWLQRIVCYVDKTCPCGEMGGSEYLHTSSDWQSAMAASTELQWYRVIHPELHSGARDCNASKRVRVSGPGLEPPSMCRSGSRRRS